MLNTVVSFQQSIILMHTDVYAWGGTSRLAATMLPTLQCRTQQYKYSGHNHTYTVSLPLPVHNFCRIKWWSIITGNNNWSIHGFAKRWGIKTSINRVAKSGSEGWCSWSYTSILIMFNHGRHCRHALPHLANKSHKIQAQCVTASVSFAA